MRKKLVVEAIGGLTNRMMAVVSGLRLASYYELDFYVCWQIAAECSASFDQLFENKIKQVDIDAKKEYEIVTIGHGSNGWTSAPRLDPSEYHGDIWLTTHGIIANATEPRDNNFVPGQGIIFDLSRYARVLTIKKEILESADTLPFERRRTFGLHIRRPYSESVDIAQSLHEGERSIYGGIPDSYFVDFSEKLLSFDPDIQILLCTNSLKSEENISSALGNKIISLSKQNAANTYASGSAQEALRDIVLLSRTFGIARQVDTNFSFFASLNNLLPNYVFISNRSSIVSDTALIRLMENGHVDVDRSDDSARKFVDPLFNMWRL